MNKVSLYVKTMNLHISKHAFDKYPTTEEHIFQAITDPDHAHRSLDPVIGHESCIFARIDPAYGQRYFVPVIYDGVIEPGDYDQGGKVGRVMTAYFPDGANNSKHIGEIFWSKQQVDEARVVTAAPHSDDEEEIK